MVTAMSAANTGTELQNVASARLNLGVAAEAAAEVAAEAAAAKAATEDPEDLFSV